MKFVHVCIVARDADRLSDFYQTVFGFEIRRPRQQKTGADVARGIGMNETEFHSIWLSLPEADAPFLELIEFKESRERSIPKVNEPGLGHLSFSVDDIQAVQLAVIEAGGMRLGEITNLGTSEMPFLAVYVRDPEGNIVEIEQSQ